MKILGFTIKKKAWKSFLYILPLTIILFSYQQCSRSCPVEVNREVGGMHTLPFCSIDATVACINDGRSCGEHSDSTTWYEDGDNLLSEERNCLYGDQVTDKFVEQVEYLCKDGVIGETGNTKKGDIKTAGQCSVNPFNCGTHLDSTTWWGPDSDLTKVPRLCANTTTEEIFNYYNSESEYICKNGNAKPTGQKRLAGLEKIDNCPEENNCSPHTEGSTWYEGYGTIQSPRICTDQAATKVFDIFVRMKELKCANGAVVDQAVTLIGDAISYGECPNSVKCGERQDGESWKEIVDGEIVESFICSDKLTSAESRFKKVQVKQCTNGTVTVKETIKGDMLSIGICPRKNCQPFLDGERWLADFGLETTIPKECPYGPISPEPVTTYVNLQEVVCNNGDTAPTGYLQRADKKSETKCFDCAPNSKQNCSVLNGSGVQTCKQDGSGFNICQLENCQAGFFNQNGVCVAQVCLPQSKVICDSQGPIVESKTCNENGSAYGKCQFESCRGGFVKVVDNGNKKELCLPLICNPNFIDKVGCKEASPAPGGRYERKCNLNGTAFLGCELKCIDSSLPRDGKCITYSWEATSIWSACNADCGGAQVEEYICKNNFGEKMDDTFCSTQVKPVTSRTCNVKAVPWTDGFEEVVPAVREVCPGLYLGYIEKVFQRPITYSCVNDKKVKTLGNQVLLETHNYCSAIQPARCSHDSLSVTQSLGRLSWMKTCENKIPVIKNFFETIGGADQLSTYLNDTSSSHYGKTRPRPLYVTFAEVNNTPWIAPKYGPQMAGPAGAVDTRTCIVPEGVKIFGICTSSCYTPDQKLLFKVADKQEYIPILEALNQKQESIMTLAPESVLENLKFAATPIAHFISELVESNHKTLVISMNSGGRLSVTYNHPLVASDGVIRDASEFKIGDQLIRVDGSFDEIRNIEEVIYPGKVYNVLPYGDSMLGNIVVAEGYLSGSAYYQNDGVNYLNQKILRSNLLEGIELK